MSQDSFVRFLQSVYGPLAAWSRTRVGRSGVDPEDLLGATIVRLNKLRSRITGEPEADRKFAFHVAKNVFLELQRTRTRELREAGPRGDASGAGLVDEIPADWTSVSRDAGRREAITAFLACWRKLDPDERDLLRRHFLEGEKLVEIAADLGIGAPALRMRLSRLRGLLRERMSEQSLSSIIGSF